MTLWIAETLTKIDVPTISPYWALVPICAMITYMWWSSRP